MGERTAPGGSRHIAALDGLRGLAVASVVAYHAWPSAVPGGWIGVSVFFTLSGFLITTILVRDHELSRPSLAGFWRRRARRLLPAALVTIAGTVLVVALTDPDRLAETAEAGLAATLYVHNWWSAGTTDGYWEIFASSPSPLAHMWSLAIEEQVYIVWPLVVLALGLRRALAVGGVVVVLGTWFWWDQADAYYATPFRFGEVLAGAVVAAVVLARPNLRMPLGPVAVAAAAVVVWLTLTLEEADPFVATGALTLIAVSAAVVTAWSATTPLADRMLGFEPLGWLGRRSYGIYLFHWPLLVLLDAPPIVAVAASLALAELSHRLLEWPIRSGAVLTRPVMALGAATVASAAAFGALVAVDDEPDVVAETAAALAAADTSTTTTTTTVAPSPTTAAVLGATDTAPSTSTTTTSTTTTAPPVAIGAGPTVMLMGDSTGYVLRHAVEGWVEARGGTALLQAGPLCSPVFDAAQFEDWATGFGRRDRACRPSVEAGTDLVLVIDHGLPLAEHVHLPSDTTVDITDPLLHDALRRSYESTLAQAEAVGAVVVLVSPPTPLFPELLGRPDEAAARVETYRRLIDELAQREGVFVVDVGRRIEADAERYPRTDGLHLDEPDGAINVVVDLIAPAVTFGTD